MRSERQHCTRPGVQPWRAIADDLVAQRAQPHAARMDAWRRDGLVLDTTLWGMIEAGVAAHGDTRFSFIDATGEVNLTLAGMTHRATLVANALAALGVRQGDVVLVQSPTWDVAILSFWAALRLGAVTVPVVPIYGSAEVGEIARRSGARVLILPHLQRGQPIAERLPAIGALDAVEHIVTVGGADDAISTPWEALLDPVHPQAAPGNADPADICALLYTSGTVAAPKGVMHSHRSIGAEVLSMPRIFATDRRPTFLNVLPSGHVAGLTAMLRPVRFGIHTVFLEKWDAAAAVEILRTRRIEVSTGTSFHLSGLLDSGVAAENCGLKSYLVGAASVAPSLVERAWSAGIHAFRLYGSTEQPTISAGSSADPMDRCATTDGRLMPGVDVRIVDEAGNELPRGEAGEILSIGPELCVGYTDAENNRDAFTEDGWFRTGDIGVLDEAGYLSIVDRKKDIIIRGGENISSREVEDILSRHPAVIDCAAVGAPDERYGERIAAFVRLKAGAALDMQSVAAHFAAAGVARQKTPERLIVVTADFQRNGTGKILKAPLRAQLMADT